MTYMHPLHEHEKVALAVAQGGRCACCQKIRPLVPDHDHATRVVRGMLCRSCNTGIGNLGDTEEGVAAALAYLQRAPVGTPVPDGLVCGYVIRTMPRLNYVHRCSQRVYAVGARCSYHSGT